MEKLNINRIEKKVIRKLKTIKDLELPINIYDLGLIYKIDIEIINDRISVNVKSTKIDSRSQENDYFIDKITNHICSISGVAECVVDFIDSPKWNSSMISPKSLEKLRNAS